MKLKNFCKRFFTWNRHASAGFTLVELIVVIAILAILAGVGIPVYSNYITKANQQVDITLANDIKNALMVGYYDGTVKNGATVVVYYGEGTPVVVDPDGEDLGAHAAMVAAFGENYTTMSLKYNKWETGAADVVAAYKDSTYKGTEHDLLNDVQNLTNAFETFISNQGEDIDGYVGNNFSKFLEDNKIDKTNPQNVANAMGVYVSSRTLGADQTAFVNAWKFMGNPIASFRDVAVGENTLGLVGALAATYARGEALVKYVDAQAKKDNVSTAVTDNGVTYPTLSAWFSAQDVNGANSNEVTTKMGNLNQKTTNYLMQPQLQGYTTAYFGAQAEKDAKAYLAVMGAVDESAGTLLKNLDSDTLYNDGKVENLLNTYIAAGSATTSADNAMVVVFSETANGPVATAYPIDYAG